MESAVALTVPLDEQTTYNCGITRGGQSTTGVTRSTTSWLADVDDAERRGELLLAFDLACCGLEEHPSDAGLRYGAVLALARARSTDEAARQFCPIRLGFSRI